MSSRSSLALLLVPLLVASFLATSSSHPLSRYRPARVQGEREEERGVFLDGRDQDEEWEAEKRGFQEEREQQEEDERELKLLKRYLGDDRREDEEGSDDSFVTFYLPGSQPSEDEDESPESLLERQQRAAASHAQDFLEQYGYLTDYQDNSIEHDPAERTQAIKNFQSMYHLNPTGKLDNKTLTAMVIPRCGMKDMVPHDIMSDTHFTEVATTLKAENFFVPGYKWNKNHLTWKLHNFIQSDELTPDIQRRAIFQALKLWSDAANIDFSETTDEKGDINAKFAYGDHGDGPQNAFDGPGRVLAHAFYPESPLTGELHMDQSETWTDGKKDGINLLIATAHELGHGLGLGHSKEQGALMAPYYQGYVADYKLPVDDTMAIQSIYGKREGPAQPNRPAPAPAPTSRPGGDQSRQTQPPPTRPQPQPGTAPDTCSVPFKAATETHDGRVYIYNDQWMWRMSDYGLDEGFPTLVKTYYETPPDTINAVIFTTKHMYTYIFSGNQLYMYYGFQMIRKMTIKSSGFPASPQAAVTASDGTLYLIKNGKCWAFDEEAMDLKTGTSAKVCSVVFPGAPTTFDTVVRLSDQPGYLFFFSGQNYYKYSEADRRVLPGYPKPKAGPWMGPACNAEPFTPNFSTNQCIPCFPESPYPHFPPDTTDRSEPHRGHLRRPIFQSHSLLSAAIAI